MECAFASRPIGLRNVGNEVVDIEGINTFRLLLLFGLFGTSFNAILLFCFVTTKEILLVDLPQFLQFFHFELQPFDYLCLLLQGTFNAFAFLSVFVL